VDGSEERTTSPSTRLSGSSTDNPELLVEKERIEYLQKERLHQGLEKLDERSRDIVTSRWLTDEKTGLKALAAKYGVSLERIRQIESKAFEKLLPYVDVL